MPLIKAIKIEGKVEALYKCPILPADSHSTQREAVQSPTEPGTEIYILASASPIRLTGLHWHARESWAPIALQGIAHNDTVCKNLYFPQREKEI